MKGSEKQISWATDIQTTVIGVIDMLVTDANRSPAASNPVAQARIAKCLKARQAVSTCDSAHDLIEVYRDIDLNKPLADNAPMVIALIANRFHIQYDSPAQQALIGE